jgi:hypothetical protein
MSCRSSLRAASAGAVLAVVLACLPAAATSTSLPLPGAVSGVLPEAKLVGQGTLRWLGFHVYDAALWARGTAWSEDAPFALDIRYARRIAGEQLAATSIEEMRRMRLGDEQQLRRWEQMMKRIFPDVAPGDRLIGVHWPGRGAEFYSAERLLDQVADVDFARAFFAIWLDPRTREPGLRATLIGNSARAH